MNLHVEPVPARGIAPKEAAVRASDRVTIADVAGASGVGIGTVSLTARHRADGVIVMSLPLSGGHLTAFSVAGVPLVTVDAAAPGVPQTVINDVAGGRLAGEHLLALGHTRIGFVGDRVRRGATACRKAASKPRARDAFAPCSGVIAFCRCAKFSRSTSCSGVVPPGGRDGAARAARAGAVPTAIRV